MLCLGNEISIFCLGRGLTVKLNNCGRCRGPVVVLLPDVHVH